MLFDLADPRLDEGASGSTGASSLQFRDSGDLGDAHLLKVLSRHARIELLEFGRRSTPGADVDVHRQGRSAGLGFSTPLVVAVTALTMLAQSRRIWEPVLNAQVFAAIAHRWGWWRRQTGVVQKPLIPWSVSPSHAA